ncbi:hypothetical protein [Tateyamaria sp. SN3-11]|uniref:hypothetical protein n=1 Tax=Tateyamaria sp. SN3-11 TaxID=3092147 RepID=UPI0039EAE8AE
MQADTTNYKLVRDAETLMRDEGVTRSQALERLNGDKREPSRTQFATWFELVAATEQDIRLKLAAELEKEQNNGLLQRLINWAQAFFSSGLLFVVVGIALIAWADNTQDDSHTAFTFVYVVLGIAITLYGTGTQAAGAMRSDLLTNGWFQGSMAGGAGLLAFLAGWAIVEKHTEMRGAFDQQTKYLKVAFEIESKDRTIAVDPNGHFISAHHEGLPVLTSSMENQFVVLLPQKANSEKCLFALRLEFSARDGTKVPMDDAFNFVLTPDCSENLTTEEATSAITVGLAPRDRAGADFDEYVAKSTIEFEPKIVQRTLSVDQVSMVGQNDVNLGIFE